MTQTATNSQNGLISFFTKALSGSSFEIIPVLLFILYVIGYLCLNTHLSRFPIIETNIISFNYIKASLVFITFNIPLLSVARKLVYSISAGNALSGLIITLYVINTYCLVYFVYESLTMFYGDELSEGEENMRLRALIIAYVTFGLAWAFHKSRKISLLTILLFVVIFNIFGFTFLSKACLTIALYMSAALLTAFFVFRIDITKSYLYQNKKSLFIPIYGFLFAIICIGFGWLIYDKIPQILGGGKSYSATIYLTKGEADNIKEACVLANDEVLKNQVKIVYSTDKGFYIDDNNSVIIIPADAIKGIRVKRWLLGYNTR